MIRSSHLVLFSLQVFAMSAYGLGYESMVDSMLEPVAVQESAAGIVTEAEALEAQFDFDINDQFNAIASDLAELQDIVDVDIDDELDIDDAIVDSLVDDVAESLEEDIDDIAESAIDSDDFEDRLADIEKEFEEEFEEEFED